MPKKQAVEILVIADRSGSMSSIRQDAIGGFNTFLQEQKSVKGKANFTLVLFNDKYEVPVENVDIKKVEELTESTFVPRGMTAMNDAIGKSLSQLLAKNPEKAIICILTDGAENASKEYTSAQVKDLIEQAEAKDYQVTFLAANIDAFTAGGSLGISMTNTFAFTANAAGVHEAYATMSTRSTTYRNQ